jgi:peptidase E
MRPRQIVAMGGGGFSMEPDNPTLDDYVLSLAGSERPRIGFVGTASGDADSYLVRFHAAFGPDRARASHLALFRRTVRDLAGWALSQDILYVGGGNTANMLAVWRTHGFDSVLRQAWHAGVILAGLSAGAGCWFDACVTDSFGPLAPLDDGLGLLAGSFCPHYDGEADRRPTYHALVEAGFPAGYAVDDGAAIHFVDGAPTRVVTSRDGAGAYRVEVDGGQVVDTPLEL